MIRWHGDEFERRLNDRLVKNLTSACVHLQNQSRITLSRAGRRGKLTIKGARKLAANRQLKVQWLAAKYLEVKANSKVSKQFKNVSASLRFGKANDKGQRRLLGLMVRSKPGEPPRRQTGQLRASVSREIDQSALIGRVGTNVKHGKYMEMGVRGGKTIVPKAAKVLANPETGQVFGKRIVQGDVRPRPWLRPTVNRERYNLAALLGKSM